jgi:hypothetical protein
MAPARVDGEVAQLTLRPQFSGPLSCNSGRVRLPFAGHLADAQRGVSARSPGSQRKAPRLLCRNTIYLDGVMRCDLRTERLRKGRRVADCSAVTIWVLWPVRKVSEKLPNNCRTDMVRVVPRRGS